MEDCNIERRYLVWLVVLVLPSVAAAPVILAAAAAADVCVPRN